MKKKEMTFEERLARLQAIVSTLETGSSPLEESVSLYKEGLLLAAACREQLEKARNEITVCSNGEAVRLEDDGNTEPDDTGTARPMDDLPF